MVGYSSDKKYIKYMDGSSYVVADFGGTNRLIDADKLKKVLSEMEDEYKAKITENAEWALALSASGAFSVDKIMVGVVPASYTEEEILSDPRTVETTEFEGNSHEKITMEVYSK